MRFLRSVGPSALLALALLLVVGAAGAACGDDDYGRDLGLDIGVPSDLSSHD